MNFRGGRARVAGSLVPAGRFSHYVVNFEVKIKQFKLILNMQLPFSYGQTLCLDKLAFPVGRHSEPLSFSFSRNRWKPLTLTTTKYSPGNDFEWTTQRVTHSNGIKIES